MSKHLADLRRSFNNVRTSLTKATIHLAKLEDKLVELEAEHTCVECGDTDCRTVRPTLRLFK